MGTVVVCEHQYTSMLTGVRKMIGTCPEIFRTLSVGIVVVEQAKAAGWEFLRSPGGVQHFCPEHTRRAIDERERARRNNQQERIWK
jgi:hypothetical protein